MPRGRHGLQGQRVAPHLTSIFEVYPELPGSPASHARGREAIGAWARERTAARVPGVQMRHDQTGTLFEELSADEAHTRTMLLTTRIGPNARPSTTGVYYDQWRRAPDGWRFARRTLRHDFAERP